MNNPIVRNFGHFDKAIDLACLEGLEGMRVDSGLVSEVLVVSPVGHRVIVLVSGLQKRWLLPADRNCT